MLHRYSWFRLAAVAWPLLTVTPALAIAQATAAPPVPSGPLTLDQVLQLAEPRSEAVAAAREAIRRADGELVRARSGLLPQLTASASYDRALASEFEGVFDFAGPGPGCSPFSLDPQASIDARVAELERALDCGAAGGGLFGSGSGGDGGGLEDLPFGRENSWRATLSFTQNLYSGGRNGAQQALAVAGQETARLGVTTARGQLLFDVVQAYYDAVLSQRLVTIAAATLEQASATLRQTEAALAAGTQPEFEVLRARVARDNEVPVLIRQRVARDVAFLRLKQMLDLPPDHDLQLADALSDESLPPPPVFAARVAAVERMLRPDDLSALTAATAADLPERTAVAQAGAAVRLREASLRLTEAQRRPTLSLNSTYSRIAYPDNGVAPTFDRTNWSVGATMSLPILTGGRQRGDELVARAELEQARFEQRQVAELASLDTRSAWAELIAAQATWAASAGTIQQADRAYEIANVRYTAGLSTQLELSDARLLLQQAEANRAQAARDLQVARARVALLPDLPLGGTGGVGGPAPAPRAPQPAPQAPPSAPQSAVRFANASAQPAQGQVR
jgi:outer membrane protein TolC